MEDKTTFGNIALDDEIHGELDKVFDDLHADIMDIIKNEKLPDSLDSKTSSKSPAEAPSSPSSSSLSGGPSSSSNAVGGNPVAPSGSGDSGGLNGSNGPTGGSGFFNDLWSATKSVGRGVRNVASGLWDGGKRVVSDLYNKIGSGQSTPAAKSSLGNSTPLTTKIGYGLGGAYAGARDGFNNFKRGWGKGVLHKGRTWESYCSDRVASILFKEECQDYFRLLNENRFVSLSEYARTAEPVNYYIEEALYAYLSECNWSGTILEAYTTEPIGVGDVNGSNSEDAADDSNAETNSVADPLAELKEKIKQKIHSYRTRIASLLKNFAPKIMNTIHQEEEPKPSKPIDLKKIGKNWTELPLGSDETLPPGIGDDFETSHHDGKWFVRRKTKVKPVKPVEPAEQKIEPKSEPAETKPAKKRGRPTLKFKVTPGEDDQFGEPQWNVINTREDNKIVKTFSSKEEAIKYTLKQNVEANHSKNKTTEPEPEAKVASEPVVKPDSPTEQPTEQPTEYNPNIETID